MVLYVHSHIHLQWNALEHLYLRLNTYLMEEQISYPKPLLCMCCSNCKGLQKCPTKNLLFCDWSFIYVIHFSFIVVKYSSVNVWKLATLQYS